MEIFENRRLYNLCVTWDGSNNPSSSTDDVIEENSPGNCGGKCCKDGMEMGQKWRRRRRHEKGGDREIGNLEGDNWVVL